jgi:hypothetical protein
MISVRCCVARTFPVLFSGLVLDTGRAPEMPNPFYLSFLIFYDVHRSEVCCGLSFPEYRTYNTDIDDLDLCIANEPGSNQNILCPRNQLKRPRVGSGQVD